MARPEARLLIFSPYTQQEGIQSGVNSYIEESKPYLEAEGFEVKTMRPVPLNPLQEDDKSDYHLGVGVPVNANQTRFDLAISFDKFRSRRNLEKSKADIIEIHEPAVLNAAHTIISSNPLREDGKRNAPVVGVFHAGEPPNGLDTKTRIAGEITRWIRRLKFDENGTIVGLTDGLRQTLEQGLDARFGVSPDTIKFWKGQAQGDYILSPNGVDVEMFRPDGEKFADWSLDGGKSILFTGRASDPRKGIGDLLRAHRKLVQEGMNLRLKITGEGEAIERLRETVVAGGVPNVDFIGFLSRENLAKANRTADLVVAPSRGGEGFNRTIPEGRVSNTLVVCTRIPGQRFAIGEDYAQFMAEPNDWVDLADKMRIALNLPEEKARVIVGDSQKDAVSKFAWKKVVHEKAKHLDEVMSQHGERPIWKRTRRTFVNRIPLVGNVFVRDKYYSSKNKPIQLF